MLPVNWLLWEFEPEALRLKEKEREKKMNSAIIKSNNAFSIQPIDSMNHWRFHTFTTHLCDDLGSADYVINHRAFCEFLWRKIFQPLGRELQQLVDVVDASCRCCCTLLSDNMAAPAVQYWALRVAVSIVVYILKKQKQTKNSLHPEKARALEQKVSKV